jgi:hypothetical protein
VEDVKPGSDIEIEVLSSFLGGNRELASLVRELKYALITDQQELVEKIIDEISGSKYEQTWNKILQSKARTGAPVKSRPVKGKSLEVFFE